MEFWVWGLDFGFLGLRASSLGGRKASNAGAMVWRLLHYLQQLTGYMKHPVVTKGCLGSLRIASFIKLLD